MQRSDSHRHSGVAALGQQCKLDSVYSNLCEDFRWVRSEVQGDRVVYMLHSIQLYGTIVVRSDGLQAEEYSREKHFRGVIRNVSVGAIDA
jgi:hypothetical protein